LLSSYAEVAFGDFLSAPAPAPGAGDAFSSRVLSLRLLAFPLWSLRLAGFVS